MLTMKTAHRHFISSRKINKFIASCAVSCAHMYALRYVRDVWRYKNQFIPLPSPHPIQSKLNIKRWTREMNSRTHPQILWGGGLGGVYNRINPSLCIAYALLSFQYQRVGCKEWHFISFSWEFFHLNASCLNARDVKQSYSYSTPMITRIEFPTFHSHTLWQVSLPQSHTRPHVRHCKQIHINSADTSMY